MFYHQEHPSATFCSIHNRGKVLRTHQDEADLVTIHENTYTVTTFQAAFMHMPQW